MKNSNVFKVFLALGLWCALTSQGSAKSVATITHIADSLYAKNNFADALLSYQKLDSNCSDASLLYNIGNCYYKLDDIAHAILYYERAKRYDPSNKDISFNLNLANQKTIDKLPEAENSKIQLWWTQLVMAGKNDFWAIASLWGSFLGFLLLGIFLLTKKRLLKQISFYSGIVLFIFTLSSLWLGIVQKKYINQHNRAVITISKADIRTAPSQENTTAFVLHQGATVQIVQEENEWVEIVLTNGNSGWIQKDELEII